MNLLQVTLLGVTCNGLVVLAILTNRTLKDSFLILTGNQAIFYWIFGMVYAIYIIPMLVFDSKFMMEKSHYAGYLFLMCYDVGVQAHFLVTVNRFCAVFMPMVYRSLFSAKLTKLVVFTSFLISFTTLTIFFQYLPCRCYYSEEDLSFIFNGYPICWDYDAIDAIKVCTMCLFDVNDRIETPYFNATVAEIQRHASVLNVNFWKTSDAPTTINGYQLNSGEILTAQLGGLHANENIFKDADKFNPDRFLENEKLLHQLIPFGIGKRSCVGENLARSNLYLMFGNLLLRYDIKPHKKLPSTADQLPYTSAKIPDRSVNLEFVRI